MLKDPKFWGAMATVVIIAVGLFTGVDLKKLVCEPADQPLPAITMPVQ